LPDKRLLLVEDEPGLQLALSDRLTAEGYAVATAGDGNSAITRATGEPFDVIVLDVMLPGRDGFDVAKTIRQHGVQTPILMLTARTQVVDRVVGLKLGADDYLTKPFETIELLARLEALLRRAPAGPSGMTLERYQFGEITVDVRKAEVTQKGELLDLSAKEFQLLKYFIEHRGATVSREELLHEVWGYSNTPSTRTVDVHVAWLRQKLEPNPRVPQYILTVHGLGYKFAACGLRLAACGLSFFPAYPLGYVGKLYRGQRIKQPLRIVVNDDGGAVNRLDESFRHGLVDEGGERRIEAAHVQQSARFAMQSELRPRHHLEELLKRADAARHGDEAVGELRHHRLARVHRIYDVQLGDAGLRDLSIGKRLRNHADDFSTVAHDRLGNHAHQPDAAPAIDQPDAAAREQCAHGLRHLCICLVAAETRSAKHAQSPHRPIVVDTAAHLF
jgi:two-component system alkaline phosphatase synthesis response regulator PhoP